MDSHPYYPGVRFLNAQTSPDIIKPLSSPGLGLVQSPIGEPSLEAATGAAAEAGADTPNPVGSMPVEYSNQLGEIQKAVGALLEYTVEKANFDIRDDFLKLVIPLLRKTKDELTEADEICLWSTYNQLSTLAYPVTVESLAIAKEIDHTGLEVWDSKKKGNGKEGVSFTVERCRRELRHTLIITFALVILFFFVQGYTIVVGEAVKTIKGVEIDYNLVQQKIDDVRFANKNLQEDDPILTDLDGKKKMVEGKSAGIQKLPLLFGYKCDSADEFDAHLHCLDAVARFNLLILSTHILPFVLGFLGAVAALVRSSLSGLENKSFTQGWAGRLGLRLVLGGLLGEISGIIFTPGLNELEALKLSLVFIAFLMGYSTDLAFSVFDRAIASAKEAIKPSPKTSETVHTPEPEA
jgi:hypothetical protein